MMAEKYHHRETTMRIRPPPDLLIKYKESQQEDDPIIKLEPVLNYELCQQLDAIETKAQQEVDPVINYAESLLQYYSQCLNYRFLWHLACKDVARLREERDKYHELFLDAKDETFAHEVEEANRLYSMFKSANANRFADVNIELNQKKGL